MPTYDYMCQNCGHKLEIKQKITENPLKQCPECQKETFSRIPGGGAGLHFQGRGFYITDYKKENKHSSEKKVDASSSEKKSKS